MLYVNVYIGQTRAAGWIRTLESYGFGEMCTRGELPNRRLPWAFDNGAFKDWNKDRPRGISDLAWLQRRGPLKPDEFDLVRYQRDLDYLALHSQTTPDFMTAPDLVAGGASSLAFSLSWVERLRYYRAPIYLVVQDGMDEDDVVEALVTNFAGLFVGGSERWKHQTAKRWIELAHAYERRCHIGRYGTEKKVRAALRWGADSIDSCLPLWSRENLERFLRGFRPTGSLDLSIGATP